ncbi:GFA family protein [Reinekea marinisedimentorum]|uniref:CENP-V/GFA domain-containing protein n=1 Tax=Reinekea marinisedimentorum TaxID=230495 RepID=A0A4R3IBZ7_9GAMM|nr:GFA family protein [Reinekea marinisedimentorum]TCS42038.1 hypothetical protein BCF53_104142 [Reinekea marinisedimentorum]
MSYPVEGSCQCGQVTFKIHEAPKMVIACHCKECQKLATAPYSVTAVIDYDKIEFSGELKEWSRPADSGNTSTAAFCPDCGNRLYHYNPADKATLKLKLKPVGLKDDAFYKPTVHVWTDEKQNWVEIPEGVKTFAKQP